MVGDGGGLLVWVVIDGYSCYCCYSCYSWDGDIWRVWCLLY